LLGRRERAGELSNQITQHESNLPRIL
jgi:hypothetical protein